MRKSFSILSAKENQSQCKDGLDIGLLLCHKLTKMMQSRLKVATELKKGSRFSFYILHKTDNEPFRVGKTGVGPEAIS
ncbi:MAG: hypothetical protein IBX43_03970 [Campylobacterales bacterium]|nr:hypothetical protein [Campylobacterales bacterium]